MLSGVNQFCDDIFYSDVFQLPWNKCPRILLDYSQLACNSPWLSRLLTHLLTQFTYIHVNTPLFIVFPTDEPGISKSRISLVSGYHSQPIYTVLFCSPLVYFTFPEQILRPQFCIGKLLLGWYESNLTLLGLFSLMKAEKWKVQISTTIFFFFPDSYFN